LARDTKKSRSTVYADALREYLGRDAHEQVTEAMDRVCLELEGKGDGKSDELVLAASLSSVRN
jgi:metal-responsive CopG/Arc/MetJ family transcriptional regulator